MGKRRVRASLEFDAECYALRYDQQLALVEICREVRAAMGTVRKAIRRHAATLSDEPVEREMFGSHLRHLNETAAAARALDRGEHADAVFARTSFTNRESMLMNVRRYRTRAGKPARALPPQSNGTALIHAAKRSAQVSLNVRALRLTGWNLGDAIEWSASNGKISLSRRDPAAVRPRRSLGGIVTVAAAMAGDPRSLRITISVTRIGWKPGRTARWEWDARSKTMTLSLQAAAASQTT